VTLVEQVKPRRGPEHEHMVTALEDLPAALAGVLRTEEADGRLFRSPARLYRLLADLTACSRRHCASTSAFSAFGSRAGGFIDLTGIKAELADEQNRTATLRRVAAELSLELRQAKEELTACGTVTRLPTRRQSPAISPLQLNPAQPRPHDRT
jgi:hypothetical protein